MGGTSTFSGERCAGRVYVFSRLGWRWVVAFVLTSGATVATGQTVDFRSSDLPILIVDTGGAIIPDEPKISARLMAVDNGPGRRNGVTDPPNAYDGEIGIELRGSTSQFLFDKKSFAVETRLADGSNNNVALLGLPVENDWVLHGAFSDKTLIRNALTYELYRRMGRYASRSRFCELVIDGEYLGVYVLLERVKRDNDRVDISRLEPSDTAGDALSGGYIIKIDKTEGAEQGGWLSDFPTMTDPNRQTFYQFHYPRPSEITDGQASYIRGFIHDFEVVTASDGFADPDLGYAAYLDVPSVVDYILINELTNNIDAYRLSTYLYKDRESIAGKLVAGPPWDYNIALGNADYYGGGGQTGFRIQYRIPAEDEFHGPFWWSRLLEDAALTRRIEARWRELRSSTMLTEQVWAIVDSLWSHLAEASVRNFGRWPVLDRYVWPNAVVMGSYESEMSYLKSWLSGRMRWLDDNIEQIGGSEDDEPPVLDGPVLRPIFPNPTRGAVDFSVALPSSQRVRISVVDVRGREVRVLAQGFMGNDEVKRFSVDLGDLASGVYVVRLYGESVSEARTVAVISG